MAVPDVAQLSAPGERLQVVSKIDSHNPTDGVTGLKALGVRELTYRLVFLASSILSADTHEGFANIRDDSEDVRGKPPTGGMVIPGEQGRRGREPAPQVGGKKASWQHGWNLCHCSVRRLQGGWCPYRTRIFVPPPRRRRPFFL